MCKAFARELIVYSICKRVHTCWFVVYVTLQIYPKDCKPKLLVRDRLNYGASEYTLPACIQLVSFSCSLVTWSVSWSSAHPPDPLLFTNQHTVRKSRMRSPAWSDQVSEPHWSPRWATGDSVLLLTLTFLTCVVSLSRGEQQLCVGSTDRPVDRRGYSLLTARLPSH